jgi:hypothetical protein
MISFRKLIQNLWNIIPIKKKKKKNRKKKSKQRSKKYERQRRGEARRGVVFQKMKRILEQAFCFLKHLGVCLRKIDFTW